MLPAKLSDLGYRGQTITDGLNKEVLDFRGEQLDPMFYPGLEQRRKSDFMLVEGIGPHATLTGGSAYGLTVYRPRTSTTYRSLLPTMKPNITIESTGRKNKCKTYTSCLSTLTGSWSCCARATTARLRFHAIRTLQHLRTPQASAYTSITSSACVIYQQEGRRIMEFSYK